MAENIRKYLSETRKKVDAELRSVLPAVGAYPAVIHKAMRYSTMAGGKRIRPVLVLAAYRMMGGRSRKILKTACAIEMLHTYSLIHDDLPCMDDDDLRRGKPTAHKVFGEAVAVLAGDALSALSFELLAAYATPQVTGVVARAIGSRGMIGGQVMDVLMEGKKASAREVNYIHTHKTGRLIEACVVAGAMEAGAGPATLKDISRWGGDMGLAFQIIDDILNIRGSEKQMGKRVGTDAEAQKNTYPRIYGLEQSEKKAQALIAGAKKSISRYRNPGIMLALADLIVNRIS